MQMTAFFLFVLRDCQMELSLGAPLHSTLNLLLAKLGCVLLVLCLIVGSCCLDFAFAKIAGAGGFAIPPNGVLVDGLLVQLETARRCV